MSHTKKGHMDLGVRHFAEANSTSRDLHVMHAPTRDGCGTRRVYYTSSHPSGAQPPQYGVSTRVTCPRAPAAWGENGGWKPARMSAEAMGSGSAMLGCSPPRSPDFDKVRSSALRRLTSLSQSATSLLQLLPWSPSRHGDTRSRQRRRRKRTRMEMVPRLPREQRRDRRPHGGGIWAS